MKIQILALVVLACFASHPVNSNLLNEIKEKATWKVMEPEENPFAYWTLEEI